MWLNGSCVRMVPTLPTVTPLSFCKHHASRQVIGASGEASPRPYDLRRYSAHEKDRVSRRHSALGMR